WIIGVCEDKMSNFFGKIQIFLVFGVAIAHGISIQCPGLATCPGAIVCITLSSDFVTDFTCIWIIVDHMIRTSVWSKVIFHSRIGMSDSNVSIYAVSGET